MLTVPELTTESRAVRVSERAITFAEFLTISLEDAHLELRNGILEERMAAQREHEWLFLWLASILRGYVGKRALGSVMGSRTTVEINAFGARLPDIMFVQTENEAIIQEKAVYGAPDMVIELVSPNDRPSDLIALETDYRSIGVTEIVFIDTIKRRMRLLHKRANDYEETLLTDGDWRPETIPGLELPFVWIMEEPRPEVYDILTRLLANTP